MMFKFIRYIFTDIKSSFGFKLVYFFEKIIKFPVILINKLLKINLNLPYLIRKDFIISNSDGKWLIKAKSGNDYVISIPNEYEFRKYFLKIREWKIFLDIGSHIWKWSIMLAKKKNITSYCFEPNPITYKYLSESIKLNNLNSKIFPYNYGVADKVWEMNFHLHPESAMSGLVSDSEIHKYHKKDIVNVKIIDIDNFIKNNNLPVRDIDLIKIDVEWFEENVVNGMKNLLTNCSNNLKIICEITSEDKERIIKKFCSYWFKFHTIGEQDFYFSKK